MTCAICLRLGPPFSSGYSALGADAVELLSGYDLLALIRDDLETAIESNTKFPDAATNGPFSEVAALRSLVQRSHVALAMKDSSPHDAGGAG